MKVYEYIVRIKNQASDTLRKLSSGFSSGRTGVDRFNASVSQAQKNTVSLSDATSTLARYLGPAIIGAALLGFTMKASALGREIEQTRISFEVMVGSVREGQALFKEVTELANVTPFTGRDLQGATKLLLNFGVSARKVIPTLKMLGDISGGDANRLHYLTLAFAQTSAAGRLMGQDLLQMVNAGFNPLQEISRKTGISLVVLKKKMEDGAISAAMVEAAFKGATQQGGRFFGMMDRQGQTFEGRLSTLKDKWELAMGGLGEATNSILAPVLDAAIKKLDEILDKTGKLRNDAVKQRDNFSNLQTNTLPLIDRYKELVNGGKTHTKEFADVMRQIGKDVPLAVEKWDRMGNATRINVIEAKRYIRSQEDLFKLQNSNAQTGIEDKLKKINSERAAINGVLGEVQQKKLSTSDNHKFMNTGLARLNELNEEKLQLENQLSQLRNDRTMAYLKQGGDKDGKDPFADLKKDTKKGKDKDGLDKITGGGKQFVNVTINLENLIGTQKFDVTNVKESIADMEKQTVEALLRVLNSANYAMSQ